jgi:hypothetical protein
MEFSGTVHNGMVVLDQRDALPEGARVAVVLKEGANDKNAISAQETHLPSEPFLTEEICAPFGLPRPEGERVVPIEIHDYLPQPHDIPDSE